MLTIFRFETYENKNEWPVGFMPLTIVVPGLSAAGLTDKTRTAINESATKHDIFLLISKPPVQSSNRILTGNSKWKYLTAYEITAGTF